MYIKEDIDILLKSTNGRMLLVNTGALSTKTTRDNSGIAVMTQKKGQRVSVAEPYKAGSLDSEHRYRTRNLPAAGSKPPAATAEQAAIEL